MTTAAEGTSWSEAFGRHLVDGGKLTPPDLERVLRLEKETREGVHLIVTKLGLVTETDAAQALSATLGLPLAHEDDYPAAPVCDETISTNFLKQHKLVPLREEDGGICLAMADPTDAYAISAMEMSTGIRVAPWVGVPAEIENALDRLYTAGRSGVDELARTVEGAADQVRRTQYTIDGWASYLDCRQG
jgi:general secretion pathway protein E